MSEIILGFYCNANCIFCQPAVFQQKQVYMGPPNIRVVLIKEGSVLNPLYRGVKGIHPTFKPFIDLTFVCYPTGTRSPLLRPSVGNEPFPSRPSFCPQFRSLCPLAEALAAVSACPGLVLTWLWIFWVAVWACSLWGW